MIYTSLAVLALSASALASPLPNPIHLHPKMPDARVNVALYNASNSFRDVRIAGHTYTLQQHEELHIKAPAGTLVFADSLSPHYRRGDVVLEVTPQVDHRTVAMR